LREEHYDSNRREQEVIFQMLQDSEDERDQSERTRRRERLRILTAGMRESLICPMREFEYKFAANLSNNEFDNPESALNLMGVLGWELVSVVSTLVPAAKGQPILLYFFKGETGSQ
jgi:hypothetical protein